MKKIPIFLAISILLNVFLACTTNTDSNLKTSKQTDPLPSWNAGKVKISIINYVDDVTNTESVNFIKIPDRIATFDNDGNLWSEQSAYFQLFFAIDRIKALSEDHPEWKTEQPFKAVLDDDMKELMKYGEHGLIQIVMASMPEPQSLFIVDAGIVSEKPASNEDIRATFLLSSPA